MLRSSLWALIAVVILGSTAQAQAPAVPRTDSLGDPLPPGAIARLGTLRFKHNIDLPRFSRFSGANLFSHYISETACSLDGKTIVSLAEPYGFIHVWDGADGKQRPGPWNGSAFVVQAFALAPDGATLAAVGYANQGNFNGIVINVWDIASGKQTKTLRPPPGRNQELQALVFADGGKTLISAGDGVVRCWDVAGEKLERTLKIQLPEPPPNNDPKVQTQSRFRYVFSPDGKSLAVRAFFYEFDDNQPDDRLTTEAVGFDLSNGKRQWHTSAKDADESNFITAFSGDGKRVAIAAGASKIELRDAVTGKLIDDPFLEIPPGLSDRMSALALSPNGDTLAIAGQYNSVTLWKPEVRSSPQQARAATETNRIETVRKLYGQFSQMRGVAPQSLAFAPDGKSLLIGAGADLQVYNLATLKEVKSWQGHRSWVDYVAFSPDGQRLLSGSRQISFHPEEVATWDVATGKWLQMTSTSTPVWPNIGNCSPEHSYFVGKSAYDRFGVYSLENGKLMGRLSVSAKQNVNALGFFSPGSKYYVLAGKNEQNRDVVRVFGIPSCKLLCELPALPQTNSLESSRPIAFSADDGLVAMFGRDDNQAQIFEAASGKLLKRLGKKKESDPLLVARRVNFSTVSFSPDGKLLASWSVSEPVVRIWDVATGKQKMWLPSDGEQHFRMHLAWSPDGRMLAVGDHKIQLWELAAGKVRREFSGHQGDIRSMAFSPDGKLLASGSADTTVLLWDIWGR